MTGYIQQPVIIIEYGSILFCSRFDTLHVCEDEYSCNYADRDKYHPDSPERNPHPKKARD